MKFPMNLANRRVAIFGAASGIAAELAGILAAEGAKLVLIARNQDRLKSMQGDLLTRHPAASIETVCSELGDAALHEALLASVYEKAGKIDVAVLAWGVLGDNAKLATDAAAARAFLEVNFGSYVSLLTLLAERMVKAGEGQLVVIGSVAGDRGRQSNYVYGTSKAALATFCQGLRNRLARQSVHVLLVKPGMVDTPMTAHMKKGPLFATAKGVAGDIARAIRSGKDIIYTPSYWRLVMGIITMIPERIFKKLSL